jgi:hypothetical protein
MGAINKNTNDYEYPKIASKENKYKCPCCEKDVIFRNGKIKQPHFAHYKSDSPCFYYDKPSETQVHKDAKLLLKSLLDNKKIIIINKTCNISTQVCLPDQIYCDDYYNENTKAVIEHKFYYNNANRSADVALIENDKITIIFEICYKNKTKEENRPEPWVEINAEDLINKINSGEVIDEDGNINIECMRNYKCEECIKYEEYFEEYKKQQMILYYDKLKEERLEKEKREEELRIEKEKRERLRQYQTLKQIEEDRIRKEQEEKFKNKEEERIIKEQEEKFKQTCKCGIMLLNICLCENPKYELVELNKSMYCVSCCKWKCRCK